MSRNNIPTFCIELESEEQNQFRACLVRDPDNGKGSRSIRSTSPLTRTYKGRPDEVARDLGQALYRSIFVEEIGERFDEWRRRLCSNQDDDHVRLRLVLNIRTPPPYRDPLFDWPWELLHDGEKWLALDPTLSITRCLNTRWASTPSEGDIRPPMKVLLAYAEPVDKDSVGGREILDAISGAVKPVIEPLDLVLLPHSTARMLEERVKEGFHIIHFLGHGALETEKAVMGMVFPELPEGRASDIVTASEFKRWIEDAAFRPKLFVLTACHSSSAGARANLGLAQALLDAGVEAVVAMQTELWTDEAREFVCAFYEALAKHSLIDDAMQAGRQALKLYWRDRSLETGLARVLVISKKQQQDPPTVQYHLAPVDEGMTKNVLSFPGWAVPTLFLQGDGWLGQGPPESLIVWAKDHKEMVYIQEGNFYIDRYPVTRREYRRFASAVGRSVPWGEVDAQVLLKRFSERLPKDTTWDAELVESLLPATNVTLGEVLAYAAWAGKHIPTPDEWRQAALSRCSSKEWPYPWGEEFLVGRCNTRESGYGQPWPVILSEAYKGCNPAGMCDIVGNVAEWVQAKEGQSFLCGGSFKDPAEECSVQSRTLIDNPHFKNSGVGFRCAATWSERMKQSTNTGGSGRED